MTRFHSPARSGVVLMAFALSLVAMQRPAAAAPIVAPLPSLEERRLAEPVRSILRDLFRDDGEDNFVHDDHYDWNDYRNTTSRKERVRDYYEMQKQDQKDYWRRQKEIQKDMIKRQRGW